MKYLVSEKLLTLGAQTIEALMAAEAGLRESWLDQVRTSQASDEAGGIIALDTDYDWVLAFFVWYHGGKPPREIG